MVRRHFALELPYREIKETDHSKQFTNELSPEDNVLADLITMNNGNRHVIVYEHDNKILAFLMFDDIGLHFYIEFVATNRLYHSGLRPSTRLINLLEQLGKKLGYNRIELFSLEQQIHYYQNLGFVDTGITEVGNYGNMSRMVKLLAR